ncbi:MAG TPA: hypothetical protein VF516_01640 [Kofleriaceae bacterium]
MALIENAWREIVRKALDMDPMIKKFFTDANRQLFAEGRAEGEAEGKGKALMMILGHRGLATPIELSLFLFRRIDPVTLDRWLARALSVASVDEVFM